jgi:hypothetical protein
MPFIEARFFDTLSEKEAGVVDKDIETSETRNRRGNCCLPLLFAGDVEMLIDRSIVGARDGARGLLAALVEDVADRHPGAGFHHQPSGCRADAARRPRDECDLAIQTVHRFSSIDVVTFDVVAGTLVVGRAMNIVAIWQTLRRRLNHANRTS